MTSSGHAHLDRHRYDMTCRREVAFDHSTTQKPFGVGFLYVVYMYRVGEWLWMNGFEFIPTVKVETRHPVEGSFGNEFQSICNHCRIVATWSRKTLKKLFCVFLEKRHLTGEIFKILSRKDSSRYRSTCYVQISWNLADGKSVKSRVIYRTIKTNFAWFSSSCYCADHAQNLPRPPPRMYSECSRFHSNRFTFGGVISERVNTVRASSIMNPVFGWSLDSSRITTA